MVEFCGQHVLEFDEAYGAREIPRAGVSDQSVISPFCVIVNDGKEIVLVRGRKSY